jgi:hypothetical protein
MRTLLIVAITATTLFAHHSFEAEYQTEKPVTVTGVVTKVDWVNPHAYIFFNTKDEGGVQKEIRFELGPPYALTRGGWKRDTVKIGDKITLQNAAVPKDPANNWLGALPTTSLVLENGAKLPTR